VVGDTSVSVHCSMWCSVQSLQCMAQSITRVFDVHPSVRPQASILSLSGGDEQRPRQLRSRLSSRRRRRRRCDDGGSPAAETTDRADAAGIQSCSEVLAGRRKAAGGSSDYDEERLDRPMTI